MELKVVYCSGTEAYRITTEDNKVWDQHIAKEAALSLKSFKDLMVQDFDGYLEDYNDIRFADDPSVYFQEKEDAVNAAKHLQELIRKVPLERLKKIEEYIAEQRNLYKNCNYLSEYEKGVHTGVNDTLDDIEEIMNKIDFS